MILWVSIFAIVSLILILSMVFFHHKITFSEILAQVFIPLIVCFSLSMILKTSLTLDYELYNNYIVECVHEEPWNEYIHQTCTKSVPCGTDSNGNTKYCTETYDCSYVQYHAESWTAYLNDSKPIIISESYYNRLVKLFRNNKKIGRNRGYTISGDIFQTQFDGVFDHIQPYSRKHTYTNKIPVSTSVFNFQKISDEEAEEIGLYDWGWNPRYNKDRFNTNHTLGYPKSMTLERVNAYLGMNHQINIIVLVYNNKPREIFEKQKAYWCGGNKNELVLGFGLKDGKVAWCDDFTWSESHQFLVDLRSEQEKQLNKKLDIDKVAEW